MYLTFEKNYKKDYYANKYQANGVSKLLVAREVTNEHELFGVEYEFI